MKRNLNDTHVIEFEDVTLRLTYKDYATLIALATMDGVIDTSKLSDTALSTIYKIRSQFLEQGV